MTSWGQPHSLRMVWLISSAAACFTASSWESGRQLAAPINHLRAALQREHPQIQVTDTQRFYDIDIFNLCEQTGAVLLTRYGLPQT